MAKVYVHAVRADGSVRELSAAIRAAFLQASDDLAWLSPGDTVLLKPALNSGDPYPSTTHPLAVHAVAAVLADRGADVIVGDQAGVEAVVQDSSGSIKGSTADLYAATGMAGDGGLTFIGFEQEGWDRGYSLFPAERTPSWPNGFYYTSVVDRVDHIVALPRLSTHSQAGVTLGFKNWVGILRDDSRVEFHAEGPFYSFVENAVKGTSLTTDYRNRDVFFRRMTEIALCVADKLRATLFVGTKAQLTFGPNAYAVHNSYGGLGEAYTITPDPGCVFASSDPVAAEAVALAILTDMYTGVPFTKKLSWKAALFLNGQAQELSEQSVWENPFVVHALALGLGSRDIKTQYTAVPDDLQQRLDAFIRAGRPAEAGPISTG
ncbi:DUF362 domain-containing protein [Methanoculleus taiwanensis]|nr:DUF362 domain-containing protein [Methanoculleus taiwanensis]